MKKIIGIIGGMGPFCWRQAEMMKNLTALAVRFFSLSKNFQYAPVSGIIKETGVSLWNNGEKMQEVKL